MQPFCIEKYFQISTILNALIKYKTIKSCLLGGKRKWGISEFIEACSDSLVRDHGCYVRVSERTIHDDIHVILNEILEFKTPIKQEKGLYFYSGRN